MKAKLTKSANLFQNDGYGPYGGYDLKLTIGMIVKNEEKTLEDCLTALMPILNALPSELIITDTGSTDRTVEIAEQYATKVLHFEWCDDFAAARNTGLEVARGQWFMFLDGDEIFEDTQEIIDFFNSEEYEQYGYASFVVRNYLNLQGTRYQDFHAQRLFRRFSGMHFDGTIHEHMNRVFSPGKFFECFAHHYGYAFSSEEEKEEKRLRNLTLLQKNLLDNPESQRDLFQLAQEQATYKQFDQSFETAVSGLEIEKKSPNRLFHLGFILFAVKALFCKEDYEAVISFCNEHIPAEAKPELPYLDCFFYQIASADKLNRWEEAVEAGNSYLKIYELYEKNQFQDAVLTLTSFVSITPAAKESVLYLLAKAHLQLRHADDAIQILSLLDLTLPDSITKTTTLYVEFAKQFSDYSVFGDLYQKVLELHSEDKLNAFIAYIEQYVLSKEDKRESILCALAAVNSAHPYSLLCRLRLAQSEDSSNSIQSLLEQFTQLEDSFDPLYSDFLYCGMKETIPLCRLLSRFDSEDFSSIFVYLQNQHSDFPEVSSRYLENAAAESPKELYWMLYLLERLILKRAEEKQEDECAELLENYAEAAGSYLNLVYRNDQLEEVCDVLPRLHRFMFWIGKAFTAKQSGNASVYLSSLRKALKAYPVMNNPIQILLSRYEAEEEKRRANSDEFAMLAQKMKNQVKLLIEQGHLLEAGQIAQKLAKLMPDDKDIQRFLLQTSVKPATQEMISELMQ